MVVANKPSSFSAKEINIKDTFTHFSNLGPGREKLEIPDLQKENTPEYPKTEARSFCHKNRAGHSVDLEQGQSPYDYQLEDGDQVSMNLIPSEYSRPATIGDFFSPGDAAERGDTLWLTVCLSFQQR